MYISEIFPRKYLILRLRKNPETGEIDPGGRVTLCGCDVYGCEAWRNDRVAEGARLESAYASKGHRGFESRFLRKKSERGFWPEGSS